MKITAAQIGAEQTQRQRGQARAQGDAQDGRQQAQDQSFAEHQSHALARRQAQHGQQGELRRAFDHAQGQSCMGQEGAGEERDQGQHGEVDAVGARQLSDPALCQRRVAGLHPGRQWQPGQELGSIRAGSQAQIDARDLAELAKHLLRRGDVHQDHGRGDGLA